MSFIMRVLLLLLFTCTFGGCSKTETSNVNMVERYKDILSDDEVQSYIGVDGPIVKKVHKTEIQGSALIVWMKEGAKQDSSINMLFGSVLRIQLITSESTDSTMENMFASEKMMGDKLKNVMKSERVELEGFGENAYLSVSQLQGFGKLTVRFVEDGLYVDISTNGAKGDILSEEFQDDFIELAQLVYERL